jgi:hypothetical protein
LIENASSEFFAVVEVHTLVAVVCDGSKLVGCQSVCGFDGTMEGGLIGFGIPPVLDVACPSGSDSVVFLVVGRRAECDAAFSLLDGGVAIGCCLLFNLAMSDRTREIWLSSRCFPKAARCSWLSHFEK